MESARRRRPQKARGAEQAPDRLILAAEAPLLAALALAPLFAGTYGEPLPGLLLAVATWLALLLRTALPGLPPLFGPGRLAGILLVAQPLLAALSLATSADRGATLNHLVVLSGAVAAAWLAADTVARGGGGRLTAAVLAGALLVAALGVREYIEHARAGEWGWRIFAGWTNGNFLAGYLAPSILLALGAALGRPEQFKRATWALALALFVAVTGAAVVLTASRGGLYTLLGGIVVFLVLAWRRGGLRSPEARVRVLALLLAMGVVGAAGSGALRSRIQTPGAVPLPAELCPEAGRGATGDSNAFRVLTWRGAVAMAAARPILGWGAGSWETASAPSAIGAYTAHAHNSYLQLAAETGVPALLAWLALLAVGAVRLLRRPRTEGADLVPGTAAALVAVAAHNMLDSVLFVPAAALLGWVLIGTAVAPAAAEASERAGRRWVPMLAVAGLGAAVVLASGRGLLLQGRQEAAAGSASAGETLSNAVGLAPWDQEAARSRARILGARQGRWAEALAEHERAISLAPEHPPLYYDLAQAHLRLAELPGHDPFQERLRALEAYRRGLERAPNSVRLVYARAEILEVMGNHEQALAGYRHLAQIADSPAGKVRPLGEVLDYRFARADAALARQALRERRREEAMRIWHEAACLLAGRRSYFDGSPVAYFATGERDERLERDLRMEETRLWRHLAKEYGARGRNRVASLAEEQAAAAEASLGRLPALFEELRAAEAGP